MKIIKILGGLGNQMFQYAFAIGFRERFRDIKVKIDISCFKGYPLHNGYEINSIFKNAIIPIASFSEISKMAYPYYHYRLWQIGRRILKKRGSMIVEESEAKLDLNLIKNPLDLYYDGYWQEEEYFMDFRNNILHEFEFPVINDFNNSKLLDTIKENRTVSIHVRRGDYVNHPLFKNICTIEYYKNAINHIKSIDQSISCFVIFSNDIEWTKSVFKSEFSDIKTIFVDWNNGSNSYRDMQMMSQCNHNIIANSSFSWWGAWLNQHNDKIVLAPEKWINGQSLQKTICNDWIRIKTK